MLHHESAERGLNATDVRFVFFLAATDGQGVTPKQAGEYLELSTGAMTSLIDRLVNRTLIERHPNPNDRRSVLLRLTPAGTTIADEIGRHYANAFEQAFPAGQRPMLTSAFLALGTALATRTPADV
ncbi:MarR family winged helix-turn-helix transcriptional regulator [Curtobacterium sp. MCSS17_008]|uniref:MarR family winged helix-turn-helix transcriptional regulator n=1 Tax=Curtobacterium sp. MCSS17_008 TaxID=2175647 RepID=UPI0021AC89BA|nr:MarR family transcriptional regulator [Curtobacterium sp. MCSS17_008]